MGDTACKKVKNYRITEREPLTNFQRHVWGKLVKNMQKTEQERRHGETGGGEVGATSGERMKEYASLEVCGLQDIKRRVFKSQ